MEYLSKSKNTVKQGEVSEHRFALKCFADLGYMVSWPSGTADYDLVVDVNGRLLRVQVKSSGTDSNRYMICKGTNAVKSGEQGKYPYPENAIDYFAIHDIPADEWYIIPRRDTGDRMAVSISKKNKFYKYKDNWTFEDYSVEENTLEDFFG